jgi:hypothetical protein
MDPRAGLNDVEKLNLLTYRDSNSNNSVVQPVGSRYTDKLPQFIVINCSLHCSLHCSLRKLHTCS